MIYNHQSMRKRGQGETSLTKVFIILLDFEDHISQAPEEPVTETEICQDNDTAAAAEEDHF
jgi:hypothetical protein